MGPSGKLLDQVLDHHGYKRSEVTLTNVCLCRPKDNATPTRTAIAACRPRLLAELQHSGAADVVALGATAASALVDDQRPITKLRVGPPKPATAALADSSVRRVIPTWHPAYCLRKADAFPALVSDIGKLKDRKGDAWSPPTWRVYDDATSATEVLRELEDVATHLVVDIEVGIEKDIAFEHPNNYELLSVGLGYARGKVVVIGETALADREVLDGLKRLLSKTRIIAHNGKFDLGGLYPHIGGQELWFDTMLASYCVSPSTRILRRDLTWVTAGEIQEGDEVVAFDENFNMGTSMKPATVLATKKQQAKTYKLSMANGVEIICSAAHIWPVKMYSQGQTVWRTTEQLYQSKGRKRLMHFVGPWETDTSYEGGYLAGIFDGEGHCSNTGFDNWQLAFSQKPGGVLERAKEYLIDKGIAFNVNERSDVHQVVLSGRNSIRAVGMLRPERFINNTDRMWIGRRKFNPIDIIAIEYLGVQEVIGIETTEKTFVAEGFLTHNCIDERPGNHGLKVLAVERLGAPQYDLEIQQFVPRGGNYRNIPRPILYKYNAYDVACTWDLFEMFQERLEQDALRGVHDLMVAASNQLMYLELNGITIDKAYMRDLAVEFVGRLNIIEESLNQIVTDMFHIQHPEVVESEALQKIVINPRSPKQIKEVLSDQGIAVESTNQDTIERLLEVLQVQRRMSPDAPIIQFLNTLLYHRRQQKLYSTYVEGIRKRMHRGRVYTTYLLHGTTSGRLASRNPNLQNIVRDKAIRRQFAVSKPENIFVQADFKQAEGRVITTLAQDEYLRSIFSNPNVDMFDELSDQLYGKGKWTKAVERVRTKAFFYGLSYGREAYSIALEYKMPINEAERRLQDFMSLIPATAAWQQEVRERVLSGEDLITPFGRRRRFWLITDQNQKDVLNEALSFLPQSTSSDICLTAFTRLRPMLRGLGFIRLTIHDALVAECPREHQEQVTKLLVDEMVKAGAEYTDYVPFPVDVSYGQNWGDL